ncbi:MAG TPA: riboflavin synthase [Ignavibacteria bacterium]|nr:riboflavin synthase [Ignavibacteria bacterium]
MFTGIIQTKGKVTSKTPEGDGIKFTIKPDNMGFLSGINIGDSIAINGACMTAIDITDSSFSFNTIKESLSKTNLGDLSENSYVNLETAMTMNSKLDGHIVQGHIDTTGTVKDINILENSHEFYIEFPSSYHSNIIQVGSITINGVSLTIADIVVEDDNIILIKIAIIPHTYEVTTFSELKPGDKVNIEFDMISKYVQRIMEGKK